MCIKYQFQFLIGKVKTGIEGIKGIGPARAMFQFLIGKVKTSQNKTIRSTRRSICVSIPHR